MTARRRAARLMLLAGAPGAMPTTPAGAERRAVGRDTLARDDGRDTLVTDDGRAAADGGSPVDLQAIHHAAHSGSECDRTAGAGRTPTLHQKIDSAGRADREVVRGAGAGRIP
uniref:hypothetical protein n=1 Tax=Streptomyces sp. ND04-05B TaxID=3028693 RepID=UPI0029C022CA|nr:hypothetical protein [Streptomyces sp. ND04-05B]